MMADWSPDQVLDCGCFQAQRVNQLNVSTRSRLLRQYFTSQQVVSFFIHWELSMQLAIFSIQKWTHFALTFVCVHSIQIQISMELRVEKQQQGQLKI